MTSSIDDKVMMTLQLELQQIDFKSIKSINLYWYQRNKNGPTGKIDSGRCQELQVIPVIDEGIHKLLLYFPLNDVDQKKQTNVLKTIIEHCNRHTNHFLIDVNDKFIQECCGVFDTKTHIFTLKYEQSTE